MWMDNELHNYWLSQLYQATCSEVGCACNDIMPFYRIRGHILQLPRDNYRQTQSTFSKVNLLPGQNLYLDWIWIASICLWTKEYSRSSFVTQILKVKKNGNFSEVEDIEMKAFLGLLLAAGVDRSSKRNYEEFWGNLRRSTLFKATMGIKRFKELLRNIRFDDKERIHKDDRSERQAQDKLAPICDTFYIFVENLTKA